MGAILAYIRAEADIDAPMIPASWWRTIESSRWVTIYPLGREARPDVMFHARLIMRHPSFPGRALFICTSPSAAILAHLADRIAADALSWTRTWSTLAELRADATTLATQIKAAWPDERPRDAEGQPIGTLVAHLRRMAGLDGESAEE
jgi:hypothetical protein